MTSTPDNDVRIKSIKGFDADLACAPGGTKFQFEVGKTYTVSGEIKACDNGFHAVDPANPFHVWDFHPPVQDDGRMTRYAEVEQFGEIDREVTNAGTKIASASITITAELSLPQFLKRGIAALLADLKGAPDTDIASGDRSTQAAAGDYSTQAAAGDDSTQAAAGDYSTQAAAGDGSTQAASGYGSKQAASGYGSKQAASGYGSKQAASGDSSKQAASGDGSTFSITGRNGVIACAGRGGRVAADTAAGTWISLAEYDDDGKCVGFATGCIGLDGLEAGHVYVAKGGKLVKAEEAA